MKLFSKKTGIPLILAAIFMLSSVVVLVNSSGIKKSSATIEVDLGQGDVYRNSIAITNETTALTALSNLVYSVKIQNGNAYCIADYCNTNASSWHVYKVEKTTMGPIEKELNQSLESFKISNGDILVFRYEPAK